MMADREGPHAGAAQWAFVNNIPFEASRSIWGVFACELPLSIPVQSFRSSMAINKTFGRVAAVLRSLFFVACCGFAACACAAVVCNNRTDRVRIVNRFIAALLFQKFVDQELDLGLVFGFRAGVL